MINKETAGGCKAEKHHPTCPCLNCKPRNCNSCDKLTEQHEIPKCIGKEILRMTADEMKKHTTAMSRPCHEQEDKEIPDVLNAMRKLKRQGLTPTRKDVLEIRRIGLFRQT